MCDTRTLKKVKNTGKGAAAHREISKSIRKGAKKAKEGRLEKQCTGVEEGLNKNNSKGAFQVMTDLRKQRQPRGSIIPDKQRNCLTEENCITKRLTERWMCWSTQWPEKQCTAVEESLNKNNSKMVFQVVKDLTEQRQSKVSYIQNRQGNCPLEESNIIRRWLEYCSELNNH